MSSCRSCHAPILWARSERGRRIPLDPDPYTGSSPRGLFVVHAGVAIAATPGSHPGEPLYRTHFASCPEASVWRA